MTIESPNESIYYYECSNARFRLFYFIPPGVLIRLSNKDRISNTVIDDYPDGVDLGCTEADFQEFEDLYDYRLQLDPVAIRRTFFAILSSTRNWKKFRGSGSIPAVDLERHMENVDDLLLKKKKVHADVKSLLEWPPLKQLRRGRRNWDVMQNKILKVLQKYKVEGIDPDRTLHQQKFSKIEWADGTGIEEVFIRLHQKQQKRE